MALTQGTKLGPYEIQTPLGVGGMGEVYRARDTRLERTVAVKILPPSVSGDPDRLLRFQHEARILSTLNHPNVLAMFDVGEQAGTHYLVSEFLEGQSLRETLTSGPLPRRALAAYALEIAKGLAAAHEKGVVHRDLKPDNIFITRDDRVKILDFGLAKLAPAQTSAQALQTMTFAASTTPGTVMGTVGYMSPEQVRGETVDHRSDIFSLGAVLYEMASSKRAFRGESSVETMNAILKEDVPELAAPIGAASPGLDRIVHRCLEKKPERRFQSASDLAFAIEALSATSSISSGSANVQGIEPRAKRHWLLWAATAVTGVALISATWLTGRKSANKPPQKFTRLTYEQGYPSIARFAKDGQTIVYSAQWNSEPLRIYSVRTEFPQSTRIDLPSAGLLALSPTGDMEVALDPRQDWFITGTLAQAQMAGGTPRAQQKDVIAADYAPDSKTLAIARRSNGRVQLEYPEGKVLYATAGYLDYVRVSPSGKQVAFAEHAVLGDDRGWVSVVDENGNHKRLTEEFGTVQGLAWSPRNSEIWFTATSLTTTRSLLAVDLSGKQRSILTLPQSIRLLDIAGDGRVLVSAEQQQTEIAGIDPSSGKELRALGWFDGSGLSDMLPDGKAIAFSEWGGPAGPLYLQIYRKLDGSAPVALGSGADPRFSPDGNLVAGPLLTRPPQVVLNPIGTGETRRLSLGEIDALKDVFWFPDGKHLLLEGAAPGESLRAYEMDLDGGKPQPIGSSDFVGFAVSPDGKRIAGRTASTGAAVLDLNTQKARTIPGIGPEELLAKWTADGNAVLVIAPTTRDARIYRVDAETGKRTLLKEIDPHDTAGSIRPLHVAYAERSNTYAYSMTRVLGTLYVVEGLE